MFYAKYLSCGALYILSFCILFYTKPVHRDLTDDGSIKHITNYLAESDRIITNNNIGHIEKEALLWQFVQDGIQNNVLPWKTAWPSEAEIELALLHTDPAVVQHVSVEKVERFKQYLKTNYPDFQIDNAFYRRTMQKRAGTSK
jgi:hypothetical protein